MEESIVVTQFGMTQVCCPIRIGVYTAIHMALNLSKKQFDLYLNSAFYVQEVISTTFLIITSKY